MAETGSRLDPFLAFRFDVRFDDLAVGGFQACSRLQLETEVLDYAEGGSNAFLLKFPTRTKQSTISLKSGIVDRALWDWFYGLSQGDIRLRNGTIGVRDESGSDVVAEWQFRRAFPVKWLGP